MNHHTVVGRSILRKHNKQGYQMLSAVGDNIIVKIVKQSRTTPGGLLLPNSDRDLQTGLVMSVGEGLQENDQPCKTGDIVLLDYYNENKTVRDGDDTLCFVDFSSILAVET